MPGGFKVIDAYGQSLAYFYAGTLDLASRNFACGKGYFVGFRLGAFARLSTFHVAHLLFASPL